jgi:hypothetical protein
MAQERILISSDWGKVTAELVDNAPAVERQLDFSTGTLGLWSSNHFVIYYRDGRVPQSGIILIGRVTDDFLFLIGPVR